MCLLINIYIATVFKNYNKKLVKLFDKSKKKMYNNKKKGVFMKADFLEKYVIVYGMSMPEAYNIRVKKVKEDNVEDVDVYYKKGRNFVKAGSNIDVEKLKKIFKEIESEEKGEINEINFYIHKDAIDEDFAFFYTLIDTPYAKEYFENGVKKIEGFERFLVEGEYIPIFTYRAMGVVRNSNEMLFLASKSLLS